MGRTRFLVWAVAAGLGVLIDDARSQPTPQAPPDEAAIREDMEKGAARDVQDSYALLLEDLDFSPREKVKLVAVLADIQVESMWRYSRDSQTPPIRGRKISQQERHDRIAAAIGDEKLEEFLALEQNAAAYWETRQIALLLRRNGVPLTEAQRDGIFEMLVEARGRYPVTRPEYVDANSTDRVEQTLEQLDEFDRHVIELAPSVLSPTQVVQLFEAYEAMSRERHTSLEWQKKRSVDYPGTFPWSYPARWNAR